MSDQDLQQNRPNKRAKLVSDASSLLSNHSDFVPLVRWSCVVSTNDANVYKILQKGNKFADAEILSFNLNAGRFHVGLRVSSFKAIVNVEVPSKDPRAETLLSDCLILRTNAGGRKSSPTTPLAQYEAKLTLEESLLVLHVDLSWHDFVHAREKVDTNFRGLLRKHCSIVDSAAGLDATPWDVKEFYDNVHVPVQQDPLRLDTVQCTLYPFQNRAVHWMLNREGVKALPSGQIVRSTDAKSTLPLDFEQVTDADGSTCYISHALAVVSSSRSDVIEQYGTIKGGILAEAMGLGKTVEMIALMCSHSRDKTPIEPWNSEALVETNATLIITPPTILEQWKQELREHAPSLRVFHYAGIKSSSKRKDDIVRVLAEQDVVLTTYSVIASEIHYVQEAPDRNLRSRPRRTPPKSPLTQLLWWRCLLDEAQMVESGVSNAAIVARLIPRVNAWAVTGTPLKQSHRDLYGLMLFLKYEPWCKSTRLWDHLVFYYRPLFREFIGATALRHSKDLVRDELRIPPQSRQVVTIPFTAVEESHYAQMHYDMQQAVGLDASGAPLNGEWSPNDPVTIESMRTWLQRLRQTCLHPEIGGRNRKALGKRGGGPLRTVAQVLEVMIEQNDAILHTEKRNMLVARANRARILEHARESQAAQDIFKECYAEASTFVESCRDDLRRELDKAKIRRRNNKSSVADSETEEDEDPDASLTTARQRLRSALEVQHVCAFFIGNTFYQLKQKPELELVSVLSDSQPDIDKESAGPANNVPSDTTISAPSTESQTAPEEVAQKAAAEELERLEAEAYEDAKRIRKELLTEARVKAQKRVRTIRAKKQDSGLVVVPKLKYSEDDHGGIESRKVFEKLYHYCIAMNDHADKFAEIRSRMTDMLCQTLVDEEDGVELTGEEYEDSTKHQDEMYVIMEMLRALFADRNDAITGQENLLLKQETKQFLRTAKEGEGPAPELMIKLLAERAKIRIDPLQHGSLRGILTELRSLASALEWQESTSARARAELVIVNDLLKYVQKLHAEQTRAMSMLEQEVNLYRDTMNARLDYYRALQVISDMVAPIGDDDSVGQPANQILINRAREAEDIAAKKLSVILAKRRYLLNLKGEQEDEEQVKICIICQFEFEIGTLTVCGHQFCKECIQMWWSEHRNCPVCKRRLQLADFFDVTYKLVEAVKDPEDSLHEREASTEVSPSVPNAIYATMSPSVLQQIQSIDLRGSSYGSKVDTLVRHILYLRRSDPGSKTIVFSQYRDFLEVLSRSMRDNSIIHSKFDDKDGILDFKTNPANECFLLHAKAHAAGLNLVCANHVVLCEPLINTAIELQAVARVHRIGQLRATYIWMYLIEGTVEEAIYDISVKRRLAHMDSRSRDVSRAATPSRDHGEIAIETANAKELQAADLSKMFAAGKTGGEMVDKEDLWSCLFGNAGKTRYGNDRNRPSRGLADLGIGAGADNTVVGASSEFGRFLRADAAETRITG
ncbi:hypothetical protein LTR05_000692 [Lithohypha guttulata]|uniref:Uncharacterized protein n=1 Tax=Lithohypha guttulata TaxID=1690604 RepID=A0AAN7T4X4_9EURO|nr:hypothetical protein LTR05_000692 [Lithohypha guttulata]